ncbi:MAG: hypothetical protein JJV89_03485 [Desulfosarcina sp.]|nr:hypothetical protein [Desulfobacterales bacterium]
MSNPYTPPKASLETNDVVLKDSFWNQLYSLLIGTVIIVIGAMYVSEKIVYFSAEILNTNIGSNLTGFLLLDLFLSFIAYFLGGYFAVLVSQRKSVSSGVKLAIIYTLYTIVHRFFTASGWPFWYETLLIIDVVIGILFGAVISNRKFYNTAKINSSNKRLLTEAKSMRISPGELQTAILPLRLILWGGLICIVDLEFTHTVNGEGWRFDVINDFLGMLMITWGVFQLSRFTVHDRYRTAMAFVKVVAVFWCFDAFHHHFIYDVPGPLSFILTMFGVAAMSAIVVFCVAMCWLNNEAGFHDSARSWRTTTLLFVFIYLIPLGLFYCATAIATATETSCNINLSQTGLLLVPVFLVPLVHLFISVSRMKRESESK